jgi:ABC-type branched-subunit amino acid transport system substrate-binding protein
MRRVGRFKLLVASLTVLALLAAACGDDKPAGNATTTTQAAASSELKGMKGTTPLPTTIPADFQSQLKAIDTKLVDLNYGPEAFDAAIVIGLAAQVAKSDGIAHAKEIGGVTGDGEKCTSYKACLDLVKAGKNIDYDGVSGPLDFMVNGEPHQGTYGVLEFTDGNKLLKDPPVIADKLAQSDIDAAKEVPISGTRAGDGTLRIGTLLPETGNLAFLGPPEVAGVKLAIKQMNENGGFNGKDVALSESDSGDTKTDTANTSVDRLLTENVDAIIGAASSGVTLTVIDKITSAGVTMFSPANTSAQLSNYPDKGLYFRDAPPDLLQGQVLANIIADDNNQTLAMIVLNDPYGTGLADSLGANFIEAGGKVVERVEYDPAAATFDEQVQKLVDADADAIAVIGFDESARILAAMVTKGIGPADKPVYGCDGNMGNALGKDFAKAKKKK